MRKHESQKKQDETALIEAYKEFESSFSHLIETINNNSFDSQEINLSGVALSRDHIKRLRNALISGSECVSRIQVINLEYAEIVEFPDDIFSACDDLRELRLEGNLLTKLPALPVRPAKLMHFYAGENPLDTIATDYFVGCVSLEVVFLTNCGIRTAPLFTDSLSLTTLHLAHNPIDKLPDDYFAMAFKLRNLYLHDTKITSLPKINPKGALTELWVSSTLHVAAQDLPATAKIIKHESSKDGEIARPIMRRYLELPVNSRQRIYFNQRITDLKREKAARQQFEAKQIKFQNELHDKIQQLINFSLSALQQVQTIMRVCIDFANKKRLPSSFDEIFISARNEIERLKDIRSLLAIYVQNLESTSDFLLFEASQISLAKEILAISNQILDMLPEKLNDAQTEIDAIKVQRSAEQNLALAQRAASRASPVQFIDRPKSRGLTTPSPPPARTLSISPRPMSPANEVAALLNTVMLIQGRVNDNFASEVKSSPKQSKRHTP
jgi:Leucine-rich repeat (LRR) protein